MRIQPVKILPERAESDVEELEFVVEFPANKTIASGVLHSAEQTSDKTFMANESETVLREGWSGNDVRK